MQIASLLAGLIGLASVDAQVLPIKAQETGDTLVSGNTTYNLVPIEWSVQINNTDTPYNLTVTGTVEDVFAAITEHDFVAAQSINETVNTLVAELAANKSAIPAVAGNIDYVPTNVNCHIYEWANVHRLYQGIAYLDGLPGMPSNGPGPGNCGRVSCSYSAAIYWCNDNLETKILDGFHNIGDGVMLIIDQCMALNDHVLADGQQFFQDGWNVIARYDSC